VSRDAQPLTKTEQDTDSMSPVWTRAVPSAASKRARLFSGQTGRRGRCRSTPIARKYPLVTVGAGLIASRFGPNLGGLFLAFPAILPATLTLVARHTRNAKPAGADALGAALGAASAG
jgi:hypothetical protein